jgi:hypothetical protein
MPVWPTPETEQIARRIGTIRTVEIISGRVLLIASMFFLVLSDDVTLAALFATLSVLEPVVVWFFVVRQEQELYAALRRAGALPARPLSQIVPPAGSADRFPVLSAYVSAAAGLTLLAASVIMQAAGSRYAWLPVTGCWALTVFAVRRLIDKHEIIL